MGETYRTSEELQSIFRENDMDAILEQADHQVELDVNDCDDIVGEHECGVEAGVELYEKLLEVRKIAGNENAGIYRITHDNYGDDDALAWFVGTFDGLAAMFRANPES